MSSAVRWMSHTLAAEAHTQTGLGAELYQPCSIYEQMAGIAGRCSNSDLVWWKRISELHDERFG